MLVPRMWKNFQHHDCCKKCAAACKNVLPNAVLWVKSNYLIISCGRGRLRYSTSGKTNHIINKERSKIMFSLHRMVSILYKKTFPNWWPLIHQSSKWRFTRCTLAAHWNAEITPGEFTARESSHKYKMTTAFVCEHALSPTPSVILQV